MLTGGACTTLYTRGAFPSLDMDFVLIGGTTQARLEEAMAAAGFVRRGDRYVHPRLPFWVEFPRGPLAIGSDHRIRPVARRVRSGRLQMLSPTDSCRDRLAAFYHRNDRQSLDVAVEIARRNRCASRPCGGGAGPRGPRRDSPSSSVSSGGRGHGSARAVSAAPSDSLIE